MQRQQWLLLALDASPRPMSPVQIQKTLFLLGKEARNVVGPDFYEFAAHNFGPFSKAIYGDLEVLAERGLVRIEQSRSRRYAEYEVTQAGRTAVRQAESCTPILGKDYLKRVVEWVMNLSFETLVRSIYSKYPEYRVNSVFQG